MKVFLSTEIPQQGIDLLKKQGYSVGIGSHKGSFSQREIIAEGKGANALLVQLKDIIDAKVLDGIGPQLKVVANYAVGYNNIDLKATQERNIIATNTPDVLTESVAEHAVGLVLAITRRIPEADRFMRAGKYKGFEPDLLLGVELKEKTIGIVGHGRIGCKVAEILTKGFGMKAVYSDTQGPNVHDACSALKKSLQEVLQESDVISVHVPALPSTRHLIGKKELGLMQKSAYLVNTSRGIVVNEKELVQALKKKQITGAALDVFEQEPKLSLGLAKLENVVLTPHIGSATHEARTAMAVLAAQNIIDALSGKTPKGLLKA